MLYIGIYLIAIVTANLTILAFGPWISPFNAFLLIALDLVIRDRLHDMWNHDRLVIKMGGLILSGSLLTVIINYDAMHIALASASAFFIAGVVDGLIYHALRKHPFLVRSNGSNIGGSLADSIVFPAMAFGFPLMWGVVALQFAAKVFGGAFWSYLLERYHEQTMDGKGEASRT
tara:strand:- start:468 stop:989 length:522 start_codon:yes stop_codon:yes gene_type:complete